MSPGPRLFAGGIATESNAFVSYPTPLSAFTLRRGLEAGSSIDKVLSAFETWRDLVPAGGAELVPGLRAWAMPSGPTTRSAYETMRAELLRGLEAALPIDGVLLDLHGAMVAEGYPDCEGDLIEQCRRRVGPAVPIGVFLDHHCHLTDRMVRHASAIVAMKEWPHVDVPDRAREILSLVLRAIRGEIRPVMALFDCRMVGAYPTRRQPMRRFVESMRTLERETGVLSVTLAHGYPWADLPEVGTRVLVVTDGDPALAGRLAEEVGRRFFSLRDAVTERGDFELDEALDYAIDAADRPVILAEQGDNHLGGSAGDGTLVLRRVVERGIGDVAFGPIWDPMSVAICRAVGPGERLLLRIGGKSGPEAGEPVDLMVTVRATTERLLQPAMGPIHPMEFGEAVWVSAEPELDLVLHSRRAGTLVPTVLTDLGLDPTRKRIVVCKMWRHGEAGFAAVARDIRILRTPGAQTLDFARIPYRSRTAPYWPRVADPFA